MEKIEVKNYQVLIDKENLICAVAINTDNYKIEMDDEDLMYTVLYKKNLIKIKNSKVELTLHNCDKEFMYYAIKSINLGIFLGEYNTINQQLVAELS